MGKLGRTTRKDISNHKATDGKEAARVKKVKAQGEARRVRPALSPEARENQLISAAINLAEKQLLEGTASSQVITHYLKLGSTKERLEREKLEQEVAKLKAQTENLQSMARMEELYEGAMNAMRRYQGLGGGDEDDDDQDF